MFEVTSNSEVNLEGFNNVYEINKKELKKLVNVLDENYEKLENEMTILGYDRCYQLIEFLDLCEDSSEVLRLKNILMTYCHKLEDETFLDLYMMMQNNMVDKWLQDCSLSDLYKVKRCFQNDRNLSIAFPKTFSLIIEKDKSCHI